jgi:transcriptional regulator with XRE-family HTH domain
MPRTRDTIRTARQAEAKAIGRSLAMSRKRAGLSQAQVARALRVPQSVIAKAELGTRKLGYIEGLWLAHIYGVRPESFHQSPPED